MFGINEKELAVLKMALDLLTNELSARGLENTDIDYTADGLLAKVNEVMGIE